MRFQKVVWIPYLVDGPQSVAEAENGIAFGKGGPRYAHGAIGHRWNGLRIERHDRHPGARMSPQQPPFPWRDEVPEFANRLCCYSASCHGVPTALYCRRCRHYADVEASTPILRFGWGCEPEDIPWCCSHCGAGRDIVLVGRAARMAR